MRGKGAYGSRHCGQLKCGTHGLFRRGSRCGPRLILCPAPLPPWKREGGGENREEVVKMCQINGKKNDKWGGREFYSCRRTWLLWETHSEVFLYQSAENPFQWRRLILIREQINGGGRQSISFSHYHKANRCVLMLLQKYKVYLP